MPTRDRILDAAAVVLAERGIAGATTKQLAAAAGCSEALLYKYFADKQQIFLAVLTERVPQTVPPAPGGPLEEELTGVVAWLTGFFTTTFPMAASIFGAPELLSEHRAGVSAHGGGPAETIAMMRGRLEAARSEGRVRADADLDSAARLLVGFAFHRAFLAAYAGSGSVDDAEEFARRGVALVLPALEVE